MVVPIHMDTDMITIVFAPKKSITMESSLANTCMNVQCLLAVEPEMLESNFILTSQQLVVVEDRGRQNILRNWRKNGTDIFDKE